MAELDPDVVLNALRQKAQERRQSQRLAVPEFEADQLRVDQKVKEESQALSGWKLPNKTERDEMGRAVIKKMDEVGVTNALKKVDEFGRVLGNPFGLGDAIERGVKNLAGTSFTGSGEEIESRARTAAAKESLGPIAGPGAELVSEVGTMIATSPVTLTLKGAAVAGAFTSMLADGTEKALKEDRMPTLLETVESGALGLGLGALGQVFGNKLARWFVQKGAAKTPITMGVERAMTAKIKHLSKVYKWADESGVQIPVTDMHQFVVNTLGNKRFTENLGLHPNIDPAAWNGLNSIKAEIMRMSKEGQQGINITELARMRTGMRDRAAAGADIGTDLVLEMDNAFDKAVSRSLFDKNPMAKKAWEQIGRVEKEKIKGEYLRKIFENAELINAGGKGSLDKLMQSEFLKLNNNKKLMAKLGFTPGEKELIREGAHGTSPTIIANMADKTVGNTWIAPFWRLTLEPLIRGKGTRGATENVLEVIGSSVGQPKSAVIPALHQNMGQITNPIAPQLNDPIQNAVLPQPNPSAGQVAPSQAPMPMPSAPAPNTGPQRMPRPFTPQSRSAVPNLPKP